MRGNYQLRYAAGMYWLIHMDQAGAEFESPVCFNETGAYLWKLISTGCSREQMAAKLAGEYDLDEAEAVQDVELFLQQLERKHVQL